MAENLILFCLEKIKKTSINLIICVNKWELYVGDLKVKFKEISMNNLISNIAQRKTFEDLLKMFKNSIYCVSWLLLHLAMVNFIYFIPHNVFRSVLTWKRYIICVH